MAISLLGPTYVLEGDIASYSVNQAIDALAAGATISFDIATGGAATAGSDFYALTAADFTSTNPGISFSVTIDAITGIATVVVTNISGSVIASGATLINFSLTTIADDYLNGDSVRVSLTSTTRVVNSQVTTDISSVIRNSLSAQQWADLGGDTHVYAGISGSETSPITVSTGSNANLVSLSDAIANATLDTGDGSDTVSILVTPISDRLTDPNNNLLSYVQFGRGAYFANIITGAGDDVVNVQSSDHIEYFNSLSPTGPTPQDPPGYNQPDYYQSLVDAGTGNDYVYAFLPYQSLFIGGEGIDTVLFYGRFTDWTYSVVDSPLNGAGIDIATSDNSIDYSVWTAADYLSSNARGNTVRGNEFIQFNDVLLKVGQNLTLSGPTVNGVAVAEVAEGQTAAYSIALAGAGLASRQSVVFDLLLSDGTASITTDLAALAQDSLKGASGITLQILSVDTATGLIKARAEATRDFNAGETIATFSQLILQDSLVESAETFDLTLSGFIDPQTITTTIQADPQAIALTGPTSALAGQTAEPYAVSLVDLPLAPGASLTFTLDTVSGTATEGTDFNPLLATGITPLAGIALTAISTNAYSGAITLTAKNITSAALTAGTQLLTFGITTESGLTSDQLFFTTKLSAGIGVTVTKDSVTTSITQPDPLSIQLTGPSVVIAGQTAATYAVSLVATPLAAGASVTFTLDTVNGTATEGTNFTALVAAAITPQAVIKLTIVDIDPISGAITLTATNITRTALAAGTQLLTFGITTETGQTSDQVDFKTTLSAGTGVTVTENSVTTYITEPDPQAIELTGPTSVVSGQIAAPYLVSLVALPLAAKASITLTLDTVSETATEGTDFNPLQAAAVTPQAGISLTDISTDPISGAITLTATNNTGAVLTEGATLLSFGITTASEQISGPVNFKATLSAGTGVAVTQNSVTTAITGPDNQPTTNPSIYNPQTLIGTSNPDLLIGGFGPDLLSGGPSQDQLTGNPGNDVFQLKFGDSSADIILDFAPGQDKVEISGVRRGTSLDRVLKGASQASKILKTVETRKAASLAKTLYAYDTISGNLYFNPNGAKKGFGTGGGLIAVLSPNLELSSSDLQFSYQQPLA